MPSEKLIRILKAKSPFSDEEIASMTEAIGWDWVYANAKPSKGRLPQICFTGFSAAEKDTLAALARQSHLEVVATVTQSLAFLCAGANAGPAKLQRASEQGVCVLTREQFLNFIETGEVPNT